MIHADALAAIPPPPSPRALSVTERETMPRFGPMERAALGSSDGLGAKQKSFIDDVLALSKNERSLAVMDHGRGQQRQSGMAML